MIHPRAQAFLDAYDINDHTHIVNVIPRDEGRSSTVAVNYAGKTWTFTFGHFEDHDYVDAQCFDDAPGAGEAHVGTGSAKDNPDGPSTPVGVFTITRGGRSSLLPETGFRNHGFVAGTQITLLADAT